MKHRQLTHRFVRSIPKELEPGVLYVSMEYATAIHSCCCGCGNQVVTPFSPTDWQMAFDGETISLSPSIGNWNFSCRSHYVITRGRVAVAGTWTSGQIAAGRRQDRGNKAAYYQDNPKGSKSGVLRENKGFFEKLFSWLVGDKQP